MKQYIYLTKSVSEEGGPTIYSIEVRERYDAPLQFIYDMSIMRYIWENNDFKMRTQNEMFWYEDKFSHKYPHSCISYWMRGFLTINLKQFSLQLHIGIE